MLILIEGNVFTYHFGGNLVEDLLPALTVEIFFWCETDFHINLYRFCHLESDMTRKVIYL